MITMNAVIVGTAKKTMVIIMIITNPEKYIQTEFGNCTLYSDGYYMVTTMKEGNYKKRLHEMIVKPLVDYLKYKYPEVKWIVHHKNEKKWDNRFENLQIMIKSIHQKIHCSGWKMSDEEKDRLFQVNFGMKKGMFGERGYTYSNSGNKRNPYRRVWQSYIVYNGKTNSLGLFEDFVSANIVHELVRDELAEED